jgi:hypothetical protein
VNIRTLTAAALLLARVRVATGGGCGIRPVLLAQRQPFGGPPPAYCAPRSIVAPVPRRSGPHAQARSS